MTSQIYNRFALFFYFFTFFFKKDCKKLDTSQKGKF